MTAVIVMRKKLTIRFGRKTENSWKFMELNSRNVEKDYKKRNGRIMFPSSHDITPSISGIMSHCFK